MIDFKYSSIELRMGFPTLYTLYITPNAQVMLGKLFFCKKNTITLEGPTGGARKTFNFFHDI